MLRQELAVHQGSGPRPAIACVTLDAAMAAAAKAAFQEMLEESGLNDAERDYLKAKGITTARHLERSAADENDFIQSVVTPYLQGVSVDAVEHKADRDVAVAQTCFLVCRDLAKEARMPQPVAAPAAATQGAATNAGAPAAPGAPAASTATTLSARDWTEGINNWEAQWKGTSRSFKTAEIAGSEKVLARLLYQKLTSKNFTPLYLTEVVATRTYRSDGQLNTHAATRRQDSALDTVAKGIARQMGEEIPDYHDDGRLVWLSRTMVDDCLRANSWALRWVAMGSEDTIERVEEFWKNLIRTNAFGNHQGDMKIFQQVYTAAQWRVAYAMKAGVTFETATDELISDEKWIERQVKQAEFGKTPHGGKDSGKLADKDKGKGGGRQSDRRRSRSRSRGGKGGGRDRDRRHSRSRSRGGRPGRTQQDTAFSDRRRHDRSVSRNGTAICRNFNCGICKKPGKNDPNPENKAVCKFSHTCWNCRRPNCKGASRCSKAPVGSGNAGR